MVIKGTAGQMTAANKAKARPRHIIGKAFCTNIKHQKLMCKYDPETCQKQDAYSLPIIVK